MPLKKRCSLNAFNYNVNHKREKGEPPSKQDIAIAYSVLKKACGVDPKAEMTPSEIVAAKNESIESINKWLREKLELIESKVYYHGTKKDKFDQFKTPTSIEIMDTTKGGVVYLTTNIQAASKYAGPEGNVAIVKCDQAISYRDQLKKEGRKKAAKYVRDVYIALPESCTIIDWVSSQKKVGRKKK